MVIQETNNLSISDKRLFSKATPKKLDPPYIEVNILNRRRTDNLRDSIPGDSMDKKAKTKLKPKEMKRHDLTCHLFDQSRVRR